MNNVTLCIEVDQDSKKTGEYSSTIFEGVVPYKDKECKFLVKAWGKAIESIENNTNRYLIVNGSVSKPSGEAIPTLEVKTLMGSSDLPMDNIICLTGYLGQDPKVTFLERGDSVVDISVAPSSRKDTPTTWFNCSAWGKRGEVIGSYLTKGSPIALQGRFRPEPWTAKDGSKSGTNLSVLVIDFSFLSTKKSPTDSASSTTQNLVSQNDDINEIPY